MLYSAHHAVKLVMITVNNDYCHDGCRAWSVTIQCQ